MPGKDIQKYYSTDEAKELLEALSKPAWARLMKLADYWAWCHPEINAEQLLQEACLRVLKGSRQWPRDLNTATFFNKTMWGMVSDAAKSAERARNRMDIRLASEVPGKDAEDPVNVIEEHSDDGPSPEHDAIAKEAIDQFMRQLPDDETREILEYILEGFDKSEIKETFDLDETAYDTYTKRIRRISARIGKRRCHNDTAV